MKLRYETGSNGMLLCYGIHPDGHTHCCEATGTKAGDEARIMEQTAELRDSQQRELERANDAA
jgi:hypothetical protein